MLLFFKQLFLQANRQLFPNSRLAMKHLEVIVFLYLRSTLSIDVIITIVVNIVK